MPASGPCFDQKFHSRVVNFLDSRSRVRILCYIYKEKMVALQCCMSAILTKCKIKDNYFRNFSQSALFPETKLTAELKNMLPFVSK